MDGCVDPAQPAIGRFDRHAPDRSAEHRRDGAFAVRLGLADVSSIGTAVAERIIAEREARGPYRDMADVSRRAGLNAEQLEALLTRAQSGDDNAELARTLHGPGVVVFCHLLGIDANGHSHRPQSKEYLENIVLVDALVEQTQALLAARPADLTRLEALVQAQETFARTMGVTL